MRSDIKAWQTDYLGNLIDKDRKITYGIVQPGEFTPNGVPLIRGKDYINGWVYKYELFFVSGEIEKKFSRARVREGDILLSIAGEVGAIAIVPKQFEGANITQTTARIACSEKILNWYLYYYLSSDEGGKQINRFTKGSAQLGLNLEDIEKFRIRFPNLQTQQKIVEILFSIDEVINLTLVELEKFQNLKKGMMVDLLTKGINQVNYKESPLGSIPSSWSCIQICNSGIAIEDGDRGPNYPKQEDFKENGHCIFLNAANVTSEGFEFSEKHFISKTKDDSLRKGKLKRGDIVLTTRGTVGNLAFYDNSVPYDHLRINSGMVLIRNNAKDILSEFLYILMREYSFNFEFQRVVSGSAQPQLPISDLKKFHVIIPSKDEQHAIIRSYNTIVDSISSKKSYLNKLTHLKKSVMQELFYRGL